MENVSRTKGVFKVKKDTHNKQVSVKAGELFYYFFLIITMGAKGIGLTEGQRVFTLCLITGYFCFLLKLLFTEYSLKEWCVNIVLLLIAGLIRKSSGETAALAAVCMVIGMKDVSLIRVMKLTLGIWGSTFLFSVLRGVLGMGDGVVVVHSKLGLGPVIRYSLGYTHPNVLHVTYFVVVMLLIYSLKMTGKRLWVLAGLLFLGNLYIFLYSVSYTGIIIVTFYLCMSLYLDARKRLSYVEKILIQCIAPFCIIFPIAGPLLITGRAFDFFNRLLSTRFQLVYYFFHTFRLSLFGTRTVTPSDAHLTLDSSFAYLLMYYGVIAFVLFVTIFLMTIYRSVKNDRRKDLAVLVSTALSAVTEQFLFNLSFKNISLFFVGDFVYNILLAGEKRSIWNRRKALLILRKEELCLGFRMERRFRDACKDIRPVKCFIRALPIAAITAALFLVLWNRPDSVFVNRGLSDYEGEYFVAQADWNRADENSLFIGDMSEGQKIYEFKENIVALEGVRGLISTMVWSEIGGMVFVGIWQASIKIHRRNK